jgi:hypothetical protein
MKTRQKNTAPDRSRYLAQKPEAKRLLTLLLAHRKADGTSYFVPAAVSQIDAYNELEKLALVQTVHNEFKLSADGRVKDGYIECKITEAAESEMPT